MDPQLRTGVRRTNTGRLEVQRKERNAVRSLEAGGGELRVEREV